MSENFNNLKIFVHMGLHKTGSSFLQRCFFPLYKKEAGYVEVRRYLREFRDYVINENDLDFDKEEARRLFLKGLELSRSSSSSVTISEEMLCGNPYTNAMSRRSTVDRLSAIFPNIRFIVVFRSQESLVQSLYLQYVKGGGSCSWQTFLNDKNDSLSFSHGAYLEFGKYLDYLLLSSEEGRVKCMLYEDMKASPESFFREISDFIGFELDGRHSEFTSNVINKSLSKATSRALRLVNSVTKSYRQPYLLLPKSIHSNARKILEKFSSGGGVGIPRRDVEEFCKKFKVGNKRLSEVLGRSITEIGY